MTVERMDKHKALSIKKADAAADIELINQFSRVPLKPDEVFCFSIILCDNDIDRDMERFTNATLDALAPLFVGKTGISDHCWSFEKQFARIYRCEVDELPENNSLGEPLRVLRGSAYMLNTEENKSLIDAINGGIAKEVSIGCAINKRTCSICGEPIDGWPRSCSNGHVAGEVYDGKTCCVDLDEPIDAYEFSFVAVPAQRGAGVTKSMKNNDIESAFELLLTADISGQVDNIEKLMPKLQLALMDNHERAERLALLQFAEKYR